MLSSAQVRSIVSDEAVTRGLADPEARILVEWLVDEAELLADRLGPSETLTDGLRQLCRRGRAISRFVRLWCHDGARGSACQLAASERFCWPLPTTAEDPCELMQAILAYESDTQ